MSLWSPLPSAPLFSAEGFAPLADAIERIPGTRNEVPHLQPERPQA